MTVRVEPADWESVTPSWAVLHAQARPAAGAFVTPAFQEAWWSVFAPAQTLDLRVVYHGDTLVGVLPLCRDGADVALIGDPDVCDYMDLLAAPDHETDVAAALLNHLDAPPAAQRMELPGLVHGSPTLAVLPQAAAARGWSVEQQEEAVCPILTLASDWDGYLDSIKTRYRREVRRKMRNLLDGDARVSLEALDDPPAIVEGLPLLLRFMRESRVDKAAFLTEQMAAFFQALVGRMAPPGLLRLYFFRVDGQRCRCTTAATIRTTASWRSDSPLRSSSCGTPSSEGCSA